MKERRWLVVVFYVALLVVFLGLVLWLFPSQKSKKTEATLPKFELSLKSVNLTDINEGKKDVVYEGNDLVVKQGSEQKVYHDVDIRGRGNSTWTQPKKPYRMKFKKRTDLIGIGRARKWVFLANYLDTSHLRNEMGFYLEGMLEEEFAKQGRYAELTIDGAELGLYYITSQVEIAKNSVDLRDSMGILVEIDNLHEVREACHFSGDDMCVTVSDLVDESNEKAAIKDFMDSFNSLERAARRGDFARVNELIDVESFAVYFLLSEYTVDPDAYTTSWFLYKDGLGDKIHAGPGWDFDLALGNKQWVWTDDKNFHSPDNVMVRRSEVFANKDSDFKTSRLVYYLTDMPEFMDEVKRIYQERMSGRWNEIDNHLTLMAGKIWDSAEKDNLAWERDDFIKEVRCLKDWMKKRYQHFEMMYGS